MSEDNISTTTSQWEGSTHLEHGFLHGSLIQYFSKPYSPGKYYVGDLCYVLDDYPNRDLWMSICKLLHLDSVNKTHVNVEGDFWIDGFRFSCFSTMYGDGVYLDQHGRNYLVDSGTIGVVSVDHLLKNHEGDGGQIVEFENPFSVSIKPETGLITIGDIKINTDDVDFDSDPEWG